MSILMTIPIHGYTLMIPLSQSTPGRICNPQPPLMLIYSCFRAPRHTQDPLESPKIRFFVPCPPNQPLFHGPLNVALVPAKNLVTNYHVNHYVLVNALANPNLKHPNLHPSIKRPNLNPTLSIRLFLPWHTRTFHYPPNPALKSLLYLKLLVSHYFQPRILHPPLSTHP